MVKVLGTLRGEAGKVSTSGYGVTGMAGEGVATGAGMGTWRGVHEGVVIGAAVIPVKIQDMVRMNSNWLLPTVANGVGVGFTYASVRAQAELVTAS